MSKSRYLPILLILLLLLSLPESFTLSLRSLAISTCAWAHGTEDVEVEQLRTENFRLRHEVEELYAALHLADTLPSRAIPARVVFRSPASWSSSLWIDIGKTQVLPNSPVVVGNALVGVIDHVSGRRARVRLITDSGLHPSVRASRDGALLAKGELSGSSHPLWRSRGALLEGTGFNYDFSDSAGPARDLRSTDTILQPNDLLVTTGMDGLFPAGLEVARVTTVAPLREGAYFYDLLAEPVAPNLDDLTHLFILPPLG